MRERELEPEVFIVGVVRRACDVPVPPLRICGTRESVGARGEIVGTGGRYGVILLTNIRRALATSAEMKDTDSVPRNLQRDGCPMRGFTSVSKSSTIGVISVTKKTCAISRCRHAVLLRSYAHPDLHKRFFTRARARNRTQWGGSQRAVQIARNTMELKKGKKKNVKSAHHLFLLYLLERFFERVNIKLCEGKQRRR